MLIKQLPYGFVELFQTEEDTIPKWSKDPAYVSPALNEDFAGLPPAISFVGSLEPFRDEVVTYMESLHHAGVEVRFRVFEGAFHAAEVYTGGTVYAREVEAFQMGAFGEFLMRVLGREAVVTGC